MIKLVAFDFDGTIADTMPLYMEIFKVVADKYGGKSFSPSEIAATFGLNEEGTFRLLVPDHYKEATKELYALYESGIKERNIKPLPGIKDLLLFLRQKRVQSALITGKGTYTCSVSLQQLGLKDAFSDVFCGNPFTQSKESAMRLLRKKYNLELNEFVYVGDAISDVKSAQTVGIKCLSAAWCNTTDDVVLEKVNPGLVFHSVLHLQEYLKAAL